MDRWTIDKEIFEKSLKNGSYNFDSFIACISNAPKINDRIIIHIYGGGSGSPNTVNFLQSMARLKINLEELFGVCYF